jgi:hypothetical protein
MLFGVVPRGQEPVLLVAIGALPIGGSARRAGPRGRRRMARHGNELAYSRVWVGGWHLTHATMAWGPLGISLCMASHVELRRFETRSGMAIRAAGVLSVELPAVRVLVATLTRFRMSLVTGRPRIGVALLIRQPEDVALLAGHCRMSFIQRKACCGVGLRLDAPGAFRPRLVRRQMARGAIGTRCAVRRLVAVGTGLPFTLSNAPQSLTSAKFWPRRPLTGVSESGLTWPPRAGGIVVRNRPLAGTLLAGRTGTNEPGPCMNVFGNRHPGSFPEGNDAAERETRARRTAWDAWHIAGKILCAPAMRIGHADARRCWDRVAPRKR